MVSRGKLIHYSILWITSEISKLNIEIENCTNLHIKKALLSRRGELSNDLGECYSMQGLGEEGEEE